MNSSKQIKLGAILSYFSLGINILTGLVYTPWMIHSIGKENYGLYSLAMSVISLFVFDFGLGSAVTRFLSKYLAEGKQDKCNEFLGLVYRLYIIIDIVLFVILTVFYFFIPFVYQELTPAEIDKFNVIYLMVAFYSVLSFPFIPADGVLTAHEKFVQFKFCGLFHKLFIVVTMTICLLCGGGLYELVMVNIIAGILTVLLKLFLIRKYTDQSVKFKYYDKTRFREIIGYSGWVTVMSLAQRCIFNIAPSILGALSGSASIAILGIAITLEGYTYTFADALNGMFLPKVSRIVAGQGGGLLPLMIKVGRVQLYIIGLIFIGFICLGKEFIQLWIGNDYIESYYCAVLLIAPSVFHLPQTIGTQAIYAMNKVKQASIIFVIMAICNLGLAAALAPRFGALGISISVCIAYFVRTLCLDVMFYKKMGIDVILFFKKTFIIIVIPMMSVVFTSAVVNIIVENPSWFSFIAKVLLSVVIYSVVCYFVSMNSEEKQLVLEPLYLIFRKK